MQPATDFPSPRHLTALAALFFISGAAALIYQVLWVRELGLLFGATAEAAALTIAIFFTGIALGGYTFGRLAALHPRPLKLFGLVEIGVAAAALGHFLVADAYFALYPTLHALVGHSPILEASTKALLATVILLPAAFLMGGTLPLIGQHLIRSRATLGQRGSALYALNTLGGATGALAAGFILPMLLGFRGSYLLAIGLDLGIGLIALAMARGLAPAAPAIATPAPARPATAPRMIWAIAFLSGFATLSIEVIWTRLFAQVLQNSVYTYALVLTTFLAALAAGASLSNLLARRNPLAPATTLILLLAGCAAVAAITPHLFHHMTDGLAYLGRGRDFAGYVLEVARTTALVMFLPGIVLGAVLPYLLRVMQDRDGAPGETLGRLIAMNTTGAILGALAAGFVLLPLFGSYRALWLMAALYTLLAAGLVLQLKGAGGAARFTRVALAGAACIAALLVTTGRLDPTADLNATRINPARGESLVEFREGRAAHVSVVERNGNHFIRVNNYYTLGGSGALWSERNQALIPLLTHPQPHDVFFLGMGTGITAGASLYMPVERVTVCEILPDVVDLARRHFVPYVNGLFEDPRVTIHAEDGRHCLARSRAQYDVIIADLFTPWKAGTGNLYTLDHYAMAKQRLNRGGIYVQWIPLYQVSRDELAVISATMQAVFPEVTMWRGDLYSQRSIVALVGATEPAALDPKILLAHADALTGGIRSQDYLEGLTLRFYAGNITQSGIFSEAPLNTDDRPLIEYMAPRTHRAVITGEARFVTGGERDALYAELEDLLPPGRDPYLAALSDAQRDQVRAGRLAALSRGLRAREREDDADHFWRVFLALTPPDARRISSPANEVELGLVRAETVQ
jgi:spermidine synthase